MSGDIFDGHNQWGATSISCVEARDAVKVLKCLRQSIPASALPPRQRINLLKMSLVLILTVPGLRNASVTQARAKETAFTGGNLDICIGCKDS